MDKKYSCMLIEIILLVMLYTGSYLSIFYYPNPAGCQTKSDWHDQPDLSYLSIESSTKAKYLFKMMKELEEHIEFADK